MAAGILLSLFESVHIINSRGSYPYVNNARMETKPAIDIIEENYNQRDFSRLKNFKLKIQIIDTDGIILYNSFDKASGKADIKSMSGYDMSFSALNKDIVKYSSPVVVNGKQSATAVFYLKKDTVIKNNLYKDIFIIILPVSIAFLIVIAVLLSHVYLVKKQIVDPIKELECSADAIIKGNFDKKIKYNSNTEVGRLCASFEMMRDELKDSMEREKHLENSRKELITCNLMI